MEYKQDIMIKMPKKTFVSILDYGLGNLFSVKQACEHAGINATITNSIEKIKSSNAIFLPGVGAFGNAISSLKKLNLINTIQNQAKSGKPIIGICLGLQLLMSSSEEFGKNDGLDLIKGKVLKFPKKNNYKHILKIPHVGWNKIIEKKPNKWENTPLNKIENNSFMYFVHSYFVKPSNSNVILSMSKYFDIEFCSSICYKNIFGCQFHPERSGKQGLQIYRNIKLWIETVSK
jgi:imidazole glycerol-phosphate synthase subunit HisH